MEERDKTEVEREKRQRKIQILLQESRSIEYRDTLAGITQLFEVFITVIGPCMKGQHTYVHTCYVFVYKYSTSTIWSPAASFSDWSEMLPREM